MVGRRGNVWGLDMVNTFVSRRPSSIRTFLAWLAACEVAGAVYYLFLVLPSFVRHGLPPHLEGLGGVAVATLPLFTLGLLVAAMTFWLLPPLLLVTRAMRLARPSADILIGGVPGFIGLAAAFVNRADADLPGAWFAFVLCLAGWIAGLFYWFAAGRPRPPYS